MAKFKVQCDGMQAHLDEIVNVTWNFSGRLYDHKDEMLNAVMGLAGEAGEVLDEFKKLYFHKPNDKRFDAILSEIGDVYYYLLKLQELLGITTEQALFANRSKLTARHEELFTDKVAKA